jgi:hypothetical protein
MKVKAKGEEIKPQAAAMVAYADICRGSDETKKYVMTLFEKAHPVGVKALGGGILSFSLDEKDYYNSMFNEIIRLAKADGKPEVATAMRNYGVGKQYLEVTDK